MGKPAAPVRGAAVGGALSVAFSDVLSAETISSELSVSVRDALSMVAASDVFSLAALSSELSTAAALSGELSAPVSGALSTAAASDAFTSAAISGELSASQVSVGSLSALVTRLVWRRGALAPAETLKKFFNFEKFLREIAS